MTANKRNLERRVAEIEDDSGIGADAGDGDLVVSVVRRGIDDEPGTGIYYKARWGRDENGKFVSEKIEP